MLMIFLMTTALPRCDFGTISKKRGLQTAPYPTSVENCQIRMITISIQRFGAQGHARRAKARTLQPTTKNGLRRPKRVQIRSLFQLAKGATKKLKARLMLPRKAINAGSSTNFFKVKVRGASEVASTIT